MSSRDATVVSTAGRILRGCVDRRAVSQGMKAAAHVQRLEALQSKQQAVLRRKTEEAEAARKRLKVRHS